MAILRVKADLLRYRIPDDIIAYIAGRVQTNIRELEGCLNRLMAYQQLHRADLTMDVARAAMTSLGNDNRESRLNGKQIAQAVAEYYHISGGHVWEAAGQTYRDAAPDCHVPDTPGDGGFSIRNRSTFWWA